MPKLIFRLFFSFVVFVGVFMVIQDILTPESFGEYGHYRADAIEDNKKSESYYRGEEKCTSCHQDVFDLKFSDLHDLVSCESCHTPKINVNTDCELMPPIVEGTVEFCGVCHELNLGRLKKGVPQLDFVEHKEGRNCIECHNAHAPWEMKE
ncbi:MAG: hypothetical protein IZT56_05580 [Bacteroidetes bacterium]|nr:hypothetical protein [Bacteroidota bacterium]